ncbi:hypothetical protein EV702DRAFT_1207741 [Suillus placidus]|uniref:Uncharacterized protein n=1 Tax=Suillus placidus TaxID=48579 RepID=A0A9P6ZF12_9AGAM|nr:hypothetical protein EV702DRAFT_1207741 [Suillus placidus]
MPNTLGHKGRLPAHPHALIRLIIETFVAPGYSNPEIVTRLRKYYDTDAYNISIELLNSARGQAHTITSIGPAIERVRAHFQKQDSHDLRQTVMHEEKIIVSRCAVFLIASLHYDVEGLPTES